VETYYDEKGEVLGRAWSTMTCRKADSGDEHEPHSHNPEFASYGPYMCEGFPKTLLFDTKPRKPVNR
jgi:hypothetical protein